jgi:PilX N-terminal
MFADQERDTSMTKQDGHGSGRGKRKEAGFALIVAILALMLLTFLGLALAATTSTELQIATNYRWSQQALYNAEAGLQVGKLLLMSLDWGNILPPYRGTPWTDAAPAAAPTALRTRTDPFGNPSRNYAYAGCDTHYGRVGAGVVFDDGSGVAPYQNISTILGRTLNGSFTLWVRRPVVVTNGQITDNNANDQLILTAEGSAPYTGQAAGATSGTSFTRANKAVRLLETTITSADPQECGGGSGQKGFGSGGAGFNPCTPVGKNFGDLGGRTGGVTGLGDMSDTGGGVARGTIR